MIGNTVGTYKITQRLGEGGMGTVYKGLDLMLEREVAVKALRPELARQPDIIERFRSEAVTLARLIHQNIATLYSFLREGEDYFMVMEFVSEQSLDQIVQQHGKLDDYSAVNIVAQALDGLAQAHAQNIIRRDIKPANLMLTTNGIVKLMDFGIARVSGSARMTKTGNLIGTIEYMSPEQVRGQETDARSDLYSLGILLFELVTGQLPFRNTSDFEIMRAQAEQAPPRPRQIAPQVSPALETIILRALAKNPRDRFQSAAEFRSELLAAELSAPPVKIEESLFSSFVPPPATTTSFLQKFNWRHYASAGTGVCALLVALLWLSFSTPPPVKPDSVTTPIPVATATPTFSQVTVTTPTPSVNSVPASTPFVIREAAHDDGLPIAGSLSATSPVTSRPSLRQPRETNNSATKKRETSDAAKAAALERLRRRDAALRALGER